jgi:hypothetical protein
VRALRVVGCFVLAIVSLGALGLVLPFVKEGYDRDELPLFASFAAGLAVLAAVWCVLNRRHRAFAVAGAALLAPPILVYGGLSARVAINGWRGRALARTVRVLSLREEEIRWRGLPGPVGMRLEIEMEHAIGLEGNLFPPKVVMGGDPRPTVEDYWRGVHDGGRDAFLSAPVFEVGRSGPARDVFLRPGRTRLVYELFPSVLDRREGDALCLNGSAGRDGTSAPIAPSGTHLGAGWFFAAGGGLYVDLGTPLTDALRRGSRLEGRADSWAGLMRALDPAVLTAAGYGPCPAARHRVETCYCPPAAR